MMLQQKKIEAGMRFNNDGKLVGISFNYINFSVKSSALGTEFKSANIEKRIKFNAENLLKENDENQHQSENISR